MTSFRINILFKTFWLSYLKTDDFKQVIRDTVWPLDNNLLLYLELDYYTKHMPIDASYMDYSINNNYRQLT